MNHFNFFNIELSYYKIPAKEMNFRPNLYSLKDDTFQKSLSTLFFISDPLRNYNDGDLTVVVEA